MGEVRLCTGRWVVTSIPRRISTVDLSDERLERAVQQLQEAIPDLAVAYLFGSAATGATNEDSDVDIAVWTETRGPVLDSVSRWDLQNNLASIFRRDVDLVDLREASTVMRAQVLRSGQVVFESNETTRYRFEMTALSMYADLNEQRRELIESVQRRGSIYGG